MTRGGGWPDVNPRPARALHFDVSLLRAPLAVALPFLVCPSSSQAADVKERFLLPDQARQMDPEYGRQAGDEDGWDEALGYADACGPGWHLQVLFCHLPGCLNRQHLWRALSCTPAGLAGTLLLSVNQSSGMIPRGAHSPKGAFITWQRALPPVLAPSLPQSSPGQAGALA